MDGIYMPDGSFRSKERIVSDSYVKGEVVHKTPLPKPHNLERWHELAVQRRDQRLETEGYPKEIELEIPTDRPILIGFLGDQHIGGTYHDYEMMYEHTNIVAEHPLVYVALQGDIVDGFFFNPAQDGQILSHKEQQAFAHAMLEKLNGSILYSTVGDHDAWAEKMGAGFYHNYVEKYGNPILRGSSTVHLKVGEVDYDIVTAHQLPGHSMYNNSHPQMRESNFGTQGADVYVSGHTHRKGISQQAKKGVDGTKKQLYISTGPYKYSDDYAMKKGFSQQAEIERGAVWVAFNPHKKETVAFWNSQEAVEHMAQYLQ